MIKSILYVMTVAFTTMLSGITSIAFIDHELNLSLSLEEMKAVSMMLSILLFMATLYLGDDDD